ncbi:MAG: tRNA (N(6)-L-threonylcarbamoyladenosine(37)-C(2))-methylthiotransferase MtaB [Firmicutes bacterium]|nr:tRNA (N(6)-L-threonylcarbamoyladenosine(37)-C(2))-methylthiotransferase MtaB [Bacillota bacterium]
MDRAVAGKAVVFNFGCKVNAYESDMLLECLRQKGYEVFDSLVFADLYIVNTCAVTAEAERKSRQILSRIRAVNPSGKIIITGCASQKNKDYYISQGITHVSGASGKGAIIDMLNQDFISDMNLPLAYENYPVTPRGLRTRAYVKVQDGCNCFCSFCIVPLLRGRSRSRSICDCVKEISELSKHSQEIVITGINLSAYGENGETLADLISELKHINSRIRIGSFYVEGINHKLLDSLFSLKNFAPHFHLSLQHGSGEVLKHMNRKYTKEEYLNKVHMIRGYNSLSSITTDIIAGYPTETDKNFNESYDFIKEVGFSDLHIFPFSKREGTAVANFPLISAPLVKERITKLTALKSELANNYLNSLIGVPQNVIYESKLKNGLSVGYSQYYVRVFSKTDSETETIIPEKAHFGIF